MAVGDTHCIYVAGRDDCGFEMGSREPSLLGETNPVPDEFVIMIVTALSLTLPETLNQAATPS